MFYIWTISLEEHWSYSGEGEYHDDDLECIILAQDAETAAAKAKELTIGEQDTGEDGNTFTRLDVRVIGVLRGLCVDAIADSVTQ